MTRITVGPPAKSCCQAVENRDIRDSERPGLALEVCRVCGCRHFELSLDPGVLGLQGAAPTFDLQRRIRP
jgi:hypothetical protein